MVAVFLVLGAALNVAVAWTCAATMDIGRGTVLELYSPVNGTDHWEVFRWDRTAGTRVLSRCWAGTGPAEFNPGDPTLLLARWGTIEAPGAVAARDLSQIDEAWGYPMRSMARRFDSSLAGGMPQRPPLEPLWTGFTVNTIVFALASMVVYALLRDGGAILRRAIYSRTHALHPGPGPRL